MVQVRPMCSNARRALPSRVQSISPLLTPRSYQRNSATTPAPSVILPATHGYFGLGKTTSTFDPVQSWTMWWPMWWPSFLCLPHSKALASSLSINFEQLRMSRCAIASKGRLGYITCHDPHLQLQGVEAAEQFRERCLSCYKTDACRAPLAKRRATSPPDSCVLCHMPKEPLENISHASSADHRILRDRSEEPPAVSLRSSMDSAELIYDVTPLNLREASPDRRSSALAYTQAVPRYPELGQKGFAVLEQAARELPDDAEVQASYGLVLLIAQPRESAHAAEPCKEPLLSVQNHPKSGRSWESSIAAGSGDCGNRSLLKMRSKPPYLQLARVYSRLKDFKNAREILDLVLKVDRSSGAAKARFLFRGKP